LEDANGYIDLFFKESRRLYGKKFVTYNVHVLLHLVDDYMMFGNIDRISAFDFESYLGFIKRMLRSHSKPLEQIQNRLREGVPLVKGKNVPILKLKKLNEGKYYELCSQGITLSNKRRNAMFATTDGYYYFFCHVTRSETGHIIIHCKQIIAIDDLFNYPRASRLNGIFLVKKISSRTSEVEVDQISQKGAVFKSELGLVCCLFRS